MRPTPGYVIVSPWGWMLVHTFRRMRRDCIAEFVREGRGVLINGWDQARAIGYRCERARIEMGRE